ncbi:MULTISPECIES: hypothetical protein [unclassified Arenibacter]|uniref:hypothetical protein n=1 Tax=unclassified Arenibacter TaxID=2615047 RepID=UPI000E34454E|nr:MULTISPECIES: hypothetical protein [unclassified Arenibacter]MCM4164476.1 hypothetical protein [Arenibacter sp. A80]RFT55567.1 hypothetical protein D0S24_12800 [Arenibacter sp. P308M17]
MGYVAGIARTYFKISTTIHQRAYGAALLKQKTYATTSKADFYNYFKTTYPILIQRVPESIFASYMGVSLKAFKKIKAEHLS